MDISGSVKVETASDVLCDVCQCSPETRTGEHQFGTLQASWGPGSAHEGERYQVKLCESCFFQALANLKHERRTQNMFSDNCQDLSEVFGLVGKVE
jgi:hypothetical protein